MRCAPSATRRRSQALSPQPVKASGPSSLKPSFTGAGLQAHTFHAPESAGSRCISCHMSDVNWRLLIRRRDHTFQPPVPENTAQFGIPNACTTCHDDRTPEWAAKQMDAWWGDGDRRAQGGVACRHDVSRRIGRRDDAAGAGAAGGRSFAGSAGPRQRRRLHRAAGLGVTLRSGAQRSGRARRRSTRFDMTLERRGSRTVGEPSPSRRGDPGDREFADRRRRRSGTDRARGGRCRRSARSAIASARSGRCWRGWSIRRASCAPRRPRCSSRFGIVELPGPAGEALRKAQDEYILSLDMFPDVASNHAAKGWLEAERGNVDRRARRAQQGDRGRAELRVSVGGEGRAAGEGRKVRRRGGDVEEGPIDRAFLPEHRSAHC